MDQTTLMLFGRFPREVCTPNRWLAYSPKEFKDFVFNNQGISDLYTSVYSSNYLIDKIFFDFDYGPDVLEDTKKVYQWMKEKSYDVIPVVSGSKGYHLYMITKPKIYGPQTKLLLTKASLSIVKSVFGNFRQEVYTKPSGKKVQVFRTEERIIGPDPMICGDVRRICRIPNTLRPPENLNYCTYLPPDTFLEMTESDVIKHMKSKHTYDYEIKYNEAPSLTDFEYDFDEEYKKWEPISKPTVVVPDNANYILEQLLRPCLYRHLVSIHPSHEVRVASTVDLLVNFSPKEILGLYAQLGWEDFEEDYCLKQIKSCEKYKCYSCTKLRQHGIPTVCCVY